MSTPLRGDGHREPSPSSLAPPNGRRPTSEEEIAGLARERTNAHGTAPPHTPRPEQLGYASRELERLSRGLAQQAAGLRAHGEEDAAGKLERTAQELIELAQAMEASRKV